MDQKWGAVGLPRQNRPCLWQNAMHGEKSTSWCMVERASRKHPRRSRITACSGWEKSMSASSHNKQKGNPRKARTRRAHGGTPSANLSGRRKERAKETKGGKEKERQSLNPQTGHQIGLSRIRRLFPSAVITSSRSPAKASVAVPTIVQLWTLMDGFVMQDPKSISQKIALTRLARIGRLPVALWRILEAKRERTSLRGTVVQGHMLGPRLVVWIRQRLGGSQISKGLWVQMFPILPRERLPMALWPQARLEYTKSGRDLQCLLPPKVGNQRRIPTWRGVALVKAFLFKTKCPVVRNSVTPTPGWDMFQIDWGIEFYLQWPKGPSTQDQSWCYFTLVRMTPFHWTVAFMPIIHSCRHMWWFWHQKITSALGPWFVGCSALWQALPGGHRGASETGLWWPKLPDMVHSPWRVSVGICQPLLYLEHPRDPLECSSSPSASRCSSLWATKVFKAWYPTVGHTLVKFDQCRLGQLVEKATSISSDLEIQCWDGLRCNHAPHKLPEDMQSPTRAGIIHPVGRGHLQGLEWYWSRNLKAYCRLHFKQGVKHMDQEVDRPTSLPLSHRISHVVVQLGFRTRPLRDGGGKPSPGRLIPPLRKSAGSHLWNRRSLTSRRNSTKLSKCLSPVVRRIIHSPMNYSREFDSVLVQYPLTLQEGVPIGVDEPTLTSPGVWQSQRNGKNSLHLQVATITIQRKSFQTPSRRHSWRKKRWD